jgi:hypothetical protein
MAKIVFDAPEHEQYARLYELSKLRYEHDKLREILFIECFDFVGKAARIDPDEAKTAKHQLGHRVEIGGLYRTKDGSFWRRVK